MQAIGTLLIGLAGFCVAVGNVQAGDASLAGVVIGFRSAEANVQAKPLFKAGFWTPISVSVHSGDQGTAEGKIEVESADNEDIRTVFTTAFPRFNLPPGRISNIQAYTKPGALQTVLTTRLDLHDGQTVDTQTVEAIDPHHSLILYAGTNNKGLMQSLRGSQAADAALQNFSNCRVAHATSDEELPDRWFGYDAVDLLILPTSDSDAVVDRLLHGLERGKALSEWVHRGGNLLISCGKNPQVLTDLRTKLNLPIPATPVGTIPTRHFDYLRTWTTGLHAFPVAGNVLETGIRLQLDPTVQYEWLLPARENVELSPLVVRFPCGLGRITLVAFDLDQPPFTAWTGAADFWKALLPKCGIMPAASSIATTEMEGTGVSDVATLLQHRLDRFPSVSDAPFGWVALGILLLIAVLGPLDYYLLKRVCGRLEWSWITFPLIAGLVTAAACVGAYAMKGAVLRINKLDLVDIDLTSNRIYGTTWFTLYSPRTQEFDLQIEPSPKWTARAATATMRPVMSWFGRPESGFGGFQRARSQAVSTRAYAFGPDAVDLIGAPIPVWSSKSFTASWADTFESSATASQLQRRPLGVGLAGILGNPLAVDIEDATLIYGESESQVKALQVGTMKRGAAKPITGLPEMQLSQWLSTDSNVDDTGALIRRIMFYSAGTNTDGKRNQALRALDQSWRRSMRNRAILVGRVAAVEGVSASVENDPGAPSRVVLSNSGNGAIPLEGRLRQETFVRVFVPVSPAPR